MENMENNQPNQGDYAPPYWQQSAPKPPVSYSAGKGEFVFGVIILLLALAMTNSILFGGFYLGFAVFGCASVLCAGTYLLHKRRFPSVYAGALLSLSIVILAGFARSDDGFVKFVMGCFVFVSVNLGLCLCAGQNLRSPAVFGSLWDAFRAWFTMGLGKLPASLRGIGNGLKNSKGASKKSLDLLLGLLIALPILGIMIPLLTSADAVFDGLMALLPEADTNEWMPTLLLGCLLWSVLYTRAVALVHAQKQESKAKAARKGIPTATVNTVLLAVAFVYCVYLVSQLAYFFEGFSGILPEDYTMAQYARRGFFEMCALCVVNLCVILFAAGFVRKDKTIGMSTRLFCLFIGVVTLLFVATASAKMLMYIEAYGLTRLRLLTEVIMVFLGLTTAIVCLWLFIPKLPYMKAVMLSALIIGAAVIWADVDTVVAAYNVGAYQSGQMETVDVDYLAGLNDGAIPYLAQLTKAKDPEVAEAAQKSLHWQSAHSDDLRSWNYASHLAKQYLPEK